MLLCLQSNLRRDITTLLYDRREERFHIHLFGFTTAKSVLERSQPSPKETAGNNFLVSKELYLDVCVGGGEESKRKYISPYLVNQFNPDQLQMAMY